MRLYTLLKQIISSKQNKTWQKLGSSSGVISYSLSGYTEMAVYVSFGGVQVGQNIPISLIPSSGTKTLYVGYYNDGVIYVGLTRASAQITAQYTGYSPVLTIYAR